MLALCYAALAVIVGVLFLIKGPDGKPMCGDSPMNPGDICQSYKGGSALPDVSYEQAVRNGKEADELRPTAGVWLVGSGSFVVCCCFLIVWRGKKRQSPGRR